MRKVAISLIGLLCLCYSVNTEESLIEVKNALNGLKCECTCKCCGEPVLSKQGKKKE